MRARMFVLGFAAALATSAARAHGPQIQITNDNDKIITRALHVDGEYSLALTAPKSVYVMPLLESGGVWYSRPNSALVADVPAFPSGPGFAYGYDLVDGGPQAFAAGSVISMDFLDGLKLWNGAAYADAGATQLKAFRGSNVNIAAPPANLAITSDVGPFDSVSINPVLENYGSEGVEVHNSIRFALLGDGTSPTSVSPDGVYLLKMQVSSTQNGLAPSNPYYFLLHKNASPGDIAAAVSSLGFAPELVQAAPEPAAAALIVLGLAGVLPVRPRCQRREL